MKDYKKFTFLAIFIIAFAALAYTLMSDRHVKATEPNPSVQGVVLQDMDGNAFPLSQLKGKNVYIKLWASWCPVCLGGMEELDALSADKNRNFEVLAVVSPGHYNEKSIPEFKKWYKTQGHKHIKVLFDTEGTLLKLSHARAYPTNIIIDKNLQIKEAMAGSLTNGQVQAFFFNDTASSPKKDVKTMDDTKREVENSTNSAIHAQNSPKTANQDVIGNTNLKDLYVAGGCFWGVEAYFERIPGVVDAVSGYANGKTINPSYEEVCQKDTGHAETVHVVYDATKVNLETLLKYYFKIIDPTSIDRQGNDIGSNYRTGIYYLNDEQREIAQKVISEEQKKYNKKIVVELVPLKAFYKAEEYHQDYLKKHPNGYCHIDLSLANKPL